VKKKRQPRHKRYTLIDEMMASPTEPLPKAWRVGQLTKMYDALHQLEQAPGATPNDWRLVSDAVNLVETLVEMKVCEDDSGLLMDAITALAMAGRRSKNEKSLRLDGEGIQAVRSILSDYAYLIDVLPARVMIRCHRLTEKRLHEILDGKKLPHDVEIMGY
jgi:hypothetical protein